MILLLFTIKGFEDTENSLCTADSGILIDFFDANLKKKKNRETDVTFCFRCFDTLFEFGREIFWAFLGYHGGTWGTPGKKISSLKISGKSKFSA